MAPRRRRRRTGSSRPRTDRTRGRASRRREPLHDHRARLIPDDEHLPVGLDRDGPGDESERDRAPTAEGGVGAPACEAPRDRAVPGHDEAALTVAGDRRGPGEPQRRRPASGEPGIKLGRPRERERGEGPAEDERRRDRRTDRASPRDVHSMASVVSERTPRPDCGAKVPARCCRNLAQVRDRTRGCGPCPRHAYPHPSRRRDGCASAAP